MHDLITTAQEASALTPQERDTKVVDWLERHCGLRLTKRNELAGDNVMKPVHFMLALTAKPRIELAKAQLKRMLEPGSKAELAAALGVLSQVVARREGQEVDDQVQMAAYIAELQRYPADIALHAVSTWHRSSKWWPQWKELQDVCEALYSDRRRLLSAFQRIEHPERHPDEPEPPTDAERASVRAITDRVVASLRGHTLPKEKPGIIAERVAQRRFADALQAQAVLHPPEARE